MHYLSRSPEATREAGRLLATALGGRGLVVALAGPLGAGKTVFTQGLAAGLGLDPACVASPTFGIACEYRTPDGRRLAHVDLYRLESAAELDAAGFLDLLTPDTVVVVEWGDRFPEALPRERLELCLARSAAAPTERALDGVASGATAAAVLERWRELLVAA